MKKLIVLFSVIIFTFGIVSCSDAKKEVVNKPEQKEEVKVSPLPQLDSEKAVAKEETKVSPLPQPKPEPKRSLVIYQSSTNDVWVIKIYLDQKEVLTDALSSNQLIEQVPKILTDFTSKKEKK